MPSKIDQAFIDNLQDFTKTLESIVELMKQQSDSGDAVNQMLSTMDGPKMSKIAEDIKELTVISKSVDDRTKQILEEVKAARKSKETGAFEKIQSSENKNKIVDAVKMIVLIAGGVLAIGMAFKIIGKVDFVSVISLSIGILAISYAFKKIAEIKELTPKKVAIIGLSMITMAGAVVVSSLLLKWFQPMDIKSSLSLVLISATLGITTYMLLKAIDKIKLGPKDIPKIMLLPLVLPLIAAGIVSSSWILQYVQPITFKQALSTVFVGVAMIGASIAFKYIVEATKNLDTKNALKSTLLIPLIAGGIVASSIIFQYIQPISFKQAVSAIFIGVALIGASFTYYLMAKALEKTSVNDIMKATSVIPLMAIGLVASSFIFKLFQPLDDPWAVMGSSLAMGISIIAFLPAIYVLGKMNAKELLMGGLGVIVASAAIMASSWILSVGNYSSNFPSTEWALGTGLSIILFTPAIVVLGIIASSGIGAAAIALGSAMTLLVAATIAISSHILNKGDYSSNFPSANWALGTGLSMILFSPAILALGVIAMTGIGAVAILLGAGMVTVVANAIVSTSHILKGGDYSGGPSLEWAVSTGLLLPIFGAGMVGLALIPFGKLILDRGGDMVNAVAQSIVDVAKILKGGDFTGGPTKEWAEGVGLSLGAFSNALSISMNAGGLFSANLSADDFVNFIRTVSYGMVESAKVLKEGDWSGNMPSKAWGDGVGNAMLPFINAFSLIVSSDNSRKLIKDLQKSKASGGDSDFVYFMKEVAKTMIAVNETFKGKDWAGINSLSNINMDGFIKFIDSVSIEKKKIKALSDFAEALTDVSKSFDKLKGSGIEKFNNLTASVTIMSAVDENRLNSVIGVLNTNKEKLNDVTNAQTGSIQSNKQNSISIDKSSKSSSSNDKLTYGETVVIEKFDALIQRMDTILELVTQTKAGENVSTSDKVR